MELFAKIEIDCGELWEEIQGSVDELLQEEVPGYFGEIEDRAERLEEQWSEINYRLEVIQDELESHIHEARIREVIQTVVSELLAEARITI